MRNILIAVGSGLPGANTDQLADAFARGAREAGHTVNKIFLGKGELNGCRGCGACQTGKGCVVQDLMQEAYPLFNACDTLALASPLYFWTLSGQIKTFFDRLYAVSREDIYPHKDTVLLMTSGDDGEHTFDHPLDYYQFITSALGWTDLGSYLAGGCKGGPGKHTIAEEHLEKAYLLGKTLSEKREPQPEGEDQR